MEEYNAIVAQQDGDIAQKEAAKNKINKHLKQQQHYLDLEQQLIESQEVQISTSDPESRQLIVRNVITEVAYNVQSTVDAKHNIPINYEVTNENDSKAMGAILEQTVEVIGHSEFTAVLDKGYHTGTEFVKADKLDIEVLVAIPNTLLPQWHPIRLTMSRSLFITKIKTPTPALPETPFHLMGNGIKKVENHKRRKKQDPILMKLKH